MPDQLSDVPIHEILLDRLRLRSQVMISKELLTQAEIRTSDVLGFAADQLAISLDTTILSHKHARHSRIVEFTFPASPWQHAKKRLFPRLAGLGRWLLRTIPVVEVTKYVRIDYEAQTMFPQATVRYPKELGRPIYVTLDEVSRWTEGDGDEQDSPNDWPDP